MKTNIKKIQTVTKPVYCISDEKGGDFSPSALEPLLKTIFKQTVPLDRAE